MSDANDAEKSLAQMKIFMELRGLLPNTVYPGPSHHPASEWARRTFKRKS